MNNNVWADGNSAGGGPGLYQLAIYGMIYLGSTLMVYNIWGFIHFVRDLREHEGWAKEERFLNTPIVLLTLFFLGYLGVGIFGNPDLLVAGILFGGSVFVFIMYRFLNRITQHIIQGERLEAELLAAEKSNQAKTSFLASISHEMRTPLNVILGNCEIAHKEQGLSPKTREQITKIKLSARHLLSLINNILDINSIEAGMHSLREVEFSLRDALDQVSVISQTLCDEKGLDFAMDIDGDLHACYSGDVLVIKQVLLCLLDNAVKYTHAPGSVRLDVTARTPVESEQTIRFQVCDTGIGMDEEFVPKLFEAFSREDTSSTDRYGGIGLSLALTKKALEDMGGSIDVITAKGKGTTFTVTLSLRVVDVPDAIESCDDAQQATEQTSLDGRRILIVEDIDENAEIVIDLLELEGAECERAQNGLVAVDLFAASEEHHFDAILMDLRMPVMDGLEATRQIRAMSREDARSVPIVALTANAFESDIQQSLDAGMDAHLAKPTDVDMLYRTLSNLIRQPH